MTTQSEMTQSQASKIASMAWAGLMELAQIGPHGMPYELREALKAEKREGLPQDLAKARLVESVISGANRPERNLGDLHGVRDAHVKAMMIGARLARDAKGIEAVAHLDQQLGEAAEVLFKAWQAEQR